VLLGILFRHTGESTTYLHFCSLAALADFYGSEVVNVGRWSQASVESSLRVIGNCYWACSVIELVWDSHVIFYAVLSVIRERRGEVAPTGVRCIHVDEETPAACDRPRTSRLWSLRNTKNMKRKKMKPHVCRQSKKLMQWRHSSTSNISGVHFATKDEWVYKWNCWLNVALDCTIRVDAGVKGQWRPCQQRICSTLTSGELYY